MAIYKPPFHLFCQKCQEVTEWTYDDYNPGTYGSHCSKCVVREKKDKEKAYRKECKRHKAEWDKLTLEQKVERIYAEKMRPVPETDPIEIAFNHHDCNRVY